MRNLVKFSQKQIFTNSVFRFPLPPLFANVAKRPKNLTNDV